MILAEINEIENKIQIEVLKKNKFWFSEKIIKRQISGELKKNRVKEETSNPLEMTREAQFWKCQGLSRWQFRMS